MPAPFVKRVPGATPDAYRYEAAGLRWLADAGPGASRVVEVLEAAEDCLVLERIHPVRPARAAAAEFGRALAVTHAAGAEAFGQPPDGWSTDGWVGALPLSLRPAPAWGAWYASDRLQPYARQARDLGQLSATGATLVDRVCARLAAGEFDDDRSPARLHGDLWAGNLLFDAQGAVLIDPAAHGGHPLADLAMLHLFGAPHLATITDAYAAAAGLDAGFAELLVLHQLHPLLVHAVLFGPSYGAATEQAAKRYV